VYLHVQKLARTKRPLPATVKCRLAGRLGIGLPQTGRQIPTKVKSPSSKGPLESRVMSSDAGTSGLSIMGNRDDLDPFRSTSFCLCALYSVLAKALCCQAVRLPHLFVCFFGQILLPQCRMNGLSDLDETYNEYSLAATDDLIRFWGQRSRS